jgi:DNA-binding transcriptional ArsR family regulator
MLVEANRAARRGDLVNGHRILPFDVAVLMELDSHYNMETGTTFPSQETIALNLGCTQPSVSQAVARLVACGYVTKQRKGRTTIYRFAGPLWAHYMEIKRDKNIPTTYSLGAMSDTQEKHSLEAMSEESEGVSHSVEAMSPHSVEAMCIEPVLIEPVLPSPSSSPPPPPLAALASEALETQTPKVAAKPKKSPTSSEPEAPKLNRSKILIDTVTARGFRIIMRAQDHKALRDAGLDAEGLQDLADAYVAVYEGRFGNQWLRDNLNVMNLLGALNGYTSQKQNPPPPKPVSNKGPDITDDRKYNW